jgi:adenylosuccinate synthase
VLHLIPSGIFHPGVKCVIGGGVVLDPEALLEEAEGIRTAMSVSIDGRLFISSRCHLILPYHRVLEGAIEKSLGDRRIGTTSRGIGPAYEDKVSRRGIRVCDLLEPDALKEKIRNQVAEKNRILQAFNCSETIDAGAICESYARFADKLRPFVTDTPAMLNDLIRKGQSILFEGAQATLLDIDHGTFPFVTSSSAICRRNCHRARHFTKARASNRRYLEGLRDARGCWAVSDRMS